MSVSTERPFPQGTLSKITEIAEMLGRAYADDFRFIACLALSEGLNISPYVKGGTGISGPFAQWIPLATQNCLDGKAPKIVRVVSGEFNYGHWNKLVEQRILTDDKKDVWTVFCEDIDFSVEGICCPYVSEDNGRNDAFAFFRAMTEKLPLDGARVKLFASPWRSSCHWIAVGDEMRVSDAHIPMALDADDSDMTLIIRGDGVAEFAEKLFNICLSHNFDDWAWLDRSIFKDLACEKNRRFFAQHPEISEWFNDETKCLYAQPRLLADDVIFEHLPKKDIDARYEKENPTVYDADFEKWRVNKKSA
ncbi:MAG: hypothetical protein LBP75_01525 [Planctomycetota bacterium]|jgi:hypothetical protein|nr:hypothetical protein [Planctomycetota bacterium]